MAEEARLLDVANVTPLEICASYPGLDDFLFSDMLSDEKNSSDLSFGPPDQVFEKHPEFFAFGPARVEEAVDVEKCIPSVAEKMCTFAEETPLIVGEEAGEAAVGVGDGVDSGLDSGERSWIHDIPLRGDEWVVRRVPGDEEGGEGEEDEKEEKDDKVEPVPKRARVGKEPRYRMCNNTLVPVVPVVPEVPAAAVSVDLKMCRKKQVNSIWHLAVASLGGCGHELGHELGGAQALERLRTEVALQNTLVECKKPSVPHVFVHALREVAFMKKVIEPLHPLFRDGGYEKLLPPTGFGNFYGKIDKREDGVLNGVRVGRVPGRARGNVFLYLNN